jgi:nucleotide-binding universal stress UspA family protein
MEKLARLRVVFAATDFSSSAQRAVLRAAMLASAHRARLVVFNALDVPPEAMDAMGASPGELARHFRAELGQELRRAGWKDRRPRLTVDFRFGKPFVEIVRSARETGADLLVLGAHGRRGAHAPLPGTTAERVIRKGDLPVLVVKRAPRRAYGRVLVAVDFGQPSRTALQQALRVVPDVRRLDVLHTYGPPPEVLAASGFGSGLAENLRENQGAWLERARASMEEFLAGVDLENLTPAIHLERGSPLERLPAAVGRLRADLLVVGTHGRKGLAHALLGSVAETTIRQAACDVLVARAGRTPFRLP